MKKENKIYLTAQELAELLGVSSSHAYRLIRSMNKELEKQGYIVIAGKVPKGYFEKCWYGYGA